ncbi:unnamed protein product [marine sediment metagenome]|uniref:Uncharacterized protein n=1 Tax=marine sediment metagenome TaxID=412755 RepID=X1ELJ8_9ZZZZ
MRTVSIWVTAIILIFGTIIAWSALSPAYFETVDWVDDDISLTGDALDAYDSVKNAGNKTIRIIAPAFILTYVVWALLKMSERERYTGAYG